MLEKGIIANTIYIAEVAGKYDPWIENDLKRFSAEYNPLLYRIAFKRATGSGKPVVMAMLIAWQALNRIHNKQDARFSDTVLIVTPGITIRDRLRVLLPNDPDTGKPVYEFCCLYGIASDQHNRAYVTYTKNSGRHRGRVLVAASDDGGKTVKTKIRTPFDVRNAAAVLPTDSPVQNPAPAAGETTLARFSGGETPSVFAIGFPGAYILGEFQRAGIDLAARPAGYFDRMRDRENKFAFEIDLKANKTEFYLTSFPYLGHPHSGYNAHTPAALTGG